MTSYDDLITARNTIRTRIKNAAEDDNPEFLHKMLDALDRIDKRLASLNAQDNGGDPFFHIISRND